MKDRLAYTSDPRAMESEDLEQPSRDQPLASGPAKTRIEKKGRRGKTVTVIYDLPCTETEAKALTKDIRRSLSCGASFKDGEIVVQGDVREGVKSILDQSRLLIK